MLILELIVCVLFCVLFFNLFHYEIVWKWGVSYLLFSDQLYEYSCEWNYRPDHCMYMSVCKTAEKNGAYVVHGCRRVMHNDKQPAFKAIYDTFKQVSQCK